ncbi:SMI1/KNR4 family protein [Dactylosporangium darangshiense]|uniref:SMI1/KNR4 family protein n=1 Tax=Dactylosporangium darangshiense TaxID=579108 RepID=UPI0031EA4757
MDEEVLAALLARPGKEWGAPATPEAVAAAEEALGFALPPLLRRIYLEVANGGFGPHAAVMGVPGGYVDAEWIDIVEAYKFFGSGAGPLPERMMLLLDWGCTFWSLVDCRHPDGMMWGNEEGELFCLNLTFPQWLVNYLTADDDDELMPMAPREPRPREVLRREDLRG